MFGMPPAANGSAPGLGGGGGGGGVAYTSSGVPPYHNLGGAPNMGLPSPTAAAALYATGSTFGALPVALDAYGQPTGSADPYAAAAFAQGAAYAAANAPGGYVGIPTGLVAAPGSDSDIRTVFISGFPLDVRERELHNMLRMMPGFEACQMNWKAGAPQGFALFATSAHARQMVELLSGMQFDDESTLRAEMAHKNMFLKDDPTVKRAPARPAPLGLQPMAVATSPLQSPGGPSYLAPLPPSPGVMFAAAGAPGPLRPSTFSPVTNHRDNPPCNTLFIGNLGDAVSEVELRALFSTQPGYRQLKLVRTAKSTTAFVEFTDVQSAMLVHEMLQGAVLTSSDRGGIRVQYSKNPYGKREPVGAGGMGGLFGAGGPPSHGSAEAVSTLLGPPQIQVAPQLGNGHSHSGLSPVPQE